MTVADLVNFRPVVPVAGMEPAGWMVIGLDTNFWVSVVPDVQTGDLLGAPASVRFSPVAFHWDYGDGTTRTTTVAGASWDRLGVAEFDPTATSHVYADTGQYTVSVTVDVAAEYTYQGSEWVGIEGTIPVASVPLTGRAVHVDTVLVDQDCTADPTGPGC